MPNIIPSNHSCILPLIILGDWAAEYASRYELAQVFKDNPDDMWLTDHFFNTCLEVAKKEEKDKGKMQAEGHCNVGLCLQANSNYFYLFAFDLGSLFYLTSCFVEDYDYFHRPSPCYQSRITNAILQVSSLF